jgi:ribosomal protein S18 acetylase RimI-like enzyme
MSSVRSGDERITPGGSGPGWSVVPVGPDLLEPAARRLVEASAPGDGDAGRRFLAAARTNHIDLTNFKVSVDADHGSVREAVLIVPGAGRTGMVFTSQPTDEAAQDELAAVLNAACDDAPGVALAQALLLPSETMVGGAFTRAGFRKLAGLAYLRRRGDRRPRNTLREPWASALGADRVEVAAETPDGPGEIVTVERYSALCERVGGKAGKAMLLSGLIASYEDTQDCPDLCVLRRPEDVLESHLAVGAHEPRLWWVVRTGEIALGAMLWSPMARATEPGGGSAELVYMGLAPVLRGRGVGGGLLSYGLAELERAGLREASCAVDLTNTPARQLYATRGFRTFAERMAWVKPLRPHRASNQG